MAESCTHFWPPQVPLSVKRVIAQNGCGDPHWPGPRRVHVSMAHLPSMQLVNAGQSFGLLPQGIPQTPPARHRSGEVQSECVLHAIETHE